MHNVVWVHVPCSLKITPYFFYSWAMPADQQPGEDKYYRHIVTRWLVRDATYKQVEPTAQEISDYTEDFSKCIGAAITLGFKHILISPMVCHPRGLGWVGIAAVLVLWGCTAQLALPIAALAWMQRWGWRRLLSWREAAAATVLPAFAAGVQRHKYWQHQIPTLTSTSRSCICQAQ
jgi:hypothetical protein